jgi:hypothetical protein
VDDVHTWLIATNQRQAAGKFQAAMVDGSILLEGTDNFFQKVGVSPLATEAFRKKLAEAIRSSGFAMDSGRYRSQHSSNDLAVAVSRVLNTQIPVGSSTPQDILRQRKRHHDLRSSHTLDSDEDEDEDEDEERQAEQLLYFEQHLSNLDQNGQTVPSSVLTYNAHQYNPILGSDPMPSASPFLHHEHSFAIANGPNSPSANMSPDYKKRKMKPWDSREDSILFQRARLYGANYVKIAEAVQGRTHLSCKARLYNLCSPRKAGDKARSMDSQDQH